MNFIDLPSSSVSKYDIKRYPKTTNRSLLPWSKGDEFIVWFLKNNQLADKKIAIYNDSFGYLSSHLLTGKTEIRISKKSQERAIQTNLDANDLIFEDNQFLDLNAISDMKAEVVVLKVPKSLDLFELYLSEISESLDESAVVVCSFMTKYFTKKMIELAEFYFEDVKQSKAWKKSRLIVLSKPKTVDKKSLINEIKSDFGIFKQYYGVFSADHIDYATQFLIQNINIPEGAERVLDLASGNGVLAKVIQDKNPNLEIHLMDDSTLAIESSKLNISGDNVHFQLNNELSQFDSDSLDYIISNPPFHVDHEIDISLPLELFKQAARCLKKKGVFQLVFNNHLNYTTHLNRIFKDVKVAAENDKFTVLNCSASQL
jgi:23S rRNA (guanine1835-N2)-methyltransferase